MLEPANRHMLQNDSISLLLPTDAGLRGPIGISQAYQAVVRCVSFRIIQGQKLRPHLFGNKMHTGQPCFEMMPSTDE